MDHAAYYEMTTAEIAIDSEAGRYLANTFANNTGTINKVRIHCESPGKVKFKINEGMWTPALSSL